MPVPKGARIDPEETRSRLLDAADRLFAARAMHSVGVSEIASEAGASKLSLYRYFPSKAELASRVAVRRSQRIHEWLRRETAEAEPGRDRVLAIFDLLIEWFAQPQYRGCAVLNAVTDSRGDDERRVRATARSHLDSYRELLRARVVEAGVTDTTRADGLARQLLLLIEGATAVTVVDGEGSVAGADARAAAEILLDRAI
ncbi:MULTISPECIES: TetR/AcrR family transcriptional regulator [unclassified Microbacterium]|uniref:TetR/AcrR family transcriptional regulator n=1 Tax=unclassified Microbacterium TaxID=2609290 RepID=UPI00109C01A9|nr:MULTISPECIES: TetR/AcrR family transcriptional regulator [unclassified Microbacterium]